MDSAADSVLIIGVGNELLSDEGFGVHVVRSLMNARTSLPARVELLEAGTVLLDLLPEMSHYSCVFIVDAVQAAGAPGTLYRWQVLANSLRRLETLPPTSLHEWDLLATLSVAELLGLLPQNLFLLGAEPESLTPGTNLSPCLAQAAEELTAILCRELS